MSFERMRPTFYASHGSRLDRSHRTQSSPGRRHGHSDSLHDAFWPRGGINKPALLCTFLELLQEVPHQEHRLKRTRDGQAQESENGSC